MNEHLKKLKDAYNAARRKVGRKAERYNMTNKRNTLKRARLRHEYEVAQEQAAEAKQAYYEYWSELEKTDI